MGFRINTNIGAMNAHTNATLNNRNLDDSLSKLSSGLRINKAADDASGMVIADSLRTQANSLGQAISNANDAIGLIQTADKAMDEQIKILDTIKTKAIQAASDTQNSVSREAIQKDVNRLLEQLDNIANTTSFNGQTLLNGAYNNKSFQVGAYSNQAITASISDTRSNTTGSLSDRVDSVLLGGYTQATAAAPAGATTLTLNATTRGIGVGDIVKIEGVSGVYTVTAYASGGTVTIGTGLANAMATTTSEISMVTAAEEATPLTAAANGTAGVNFTLTTTTMLKGLGVGDVLTFTSTSGVQKGTIASIVGTTASIVFETAFTGSTTAGTSISVLDRAGAATSVGVKSGLAGEDWVRYTVEGVQLAAVQLTNSSGYGVAGTGLGAVADQINASTDQTGIKAVALTDINSDVTVSEFVLQSDMKINGQVILEAGSLVKMGDSDATIVNAINSMTTQTGVKASISIQGKLQLQSTDGRTVRLEGFGGAAGIADGTYAGELKLLKTEAGNIAVSSQHFGSGSLAAANAMAQTSQAVVTNWRLDNVVNGTNGEDSTIGLMRTQKGAMIAMDIAEAAIKELDTIRADLGSVQNQLIVTVNNISVTQVNVKAAESQIRDVDFAAESANFSKYNILAQSGSFAMAQANTIQQNVLKLLQ